MSLQKIDFSPGSNTRVQIQKEFNLPKWKLFKAWFFENFTKEDRKKISKEFYEDLSDKNVKISFVPWFITNYVNNYLSVMERDYKIISTGEVIKSILPPTHSYQIEKENEIRYFNAFQKLFEDETLQITTGYINQIIKQNNFSNMYLVVLGEQIISLHNRVEKIISKIEELKITNNIRKISKPESSAAPSIQPPPEVKDFKLDSVSDFERILNEKFGNLKINTLSEEFEDKMSDHENHHGIINKEINKISNFADKPTQRMYYYPRPTPQDVLFEEQEFVINNSYSGRNIYEWNIDGHTERQIYTVVHRMLMYSTICKNNNNGDKAIANMIIAGFTGQLKGWWDNYLSPENKNKILNTIKEEGDSQTPKENAVYTLIMNIIEHFTGRWSDNSENIRTLLQNLRCNTLTSFRWYKDTFLSRVMELPESNSPHWKSKFIDGLPSLFAERVRKNLRNGEVSINYDNFTYGRLIGTCIQEGLSLCSEIKLSQQIKRHNLYEKKQLGEFCGQFGVEKTEFKDRNLKYQNQKGLIEPAILQTFV